MKSSSLGKTGSWIALIAFALLSAARDVTARVAFRGAKIDPLFFIFFATLTSWIVLYVVASARSRKLYCFDEFFTVSSSTRCSVVFLNLATVVAFGTSMAALGKINSYTNAVVDYGASPVVCTSLAAIMRKEQVKLKSILGMFLSLAGVCFLATFEAKRAYESLNGIMLALASCLGLAFCQVWTKDVVRGGFTREGALLCRLPLLILSFGIWCYAKHTFTTEVPLLWLIIVSLVGLAIPLYLVVYAFERLDVKDVSLAFFLIPVFAFFGSYFTGQFGSNLSLISYAIAGTVVVAGILWSERA